MFDADAFRARLQGPPLLMGVLNVTPDSFSDGGRFAAPAAAIARARALSAEGADILDIGGESTRPGHAPVDGETEFQRIAVVLPEAAALGAPISIDTYKAETARRALAAGADIVNDVWGLQRDPDMAAVVAEADAPLICMHNRDAPDPAIDIVADVVGFLERSLAIARRAGIPDRRIVLDPGFGFGKTHAQSLELLTRLGEVAALGFPLLVGVSRKGFIGAYSGETDPAERLAGTLTANLLAAISGQAAIIRVHDVKAHRQALDFLAAFRAAKRPDQ